MRSAALLADREGSIAVLTLNRPQAANALSSELQNGLVERLAEIETDGDVRAIVLRAAGERTFSAGADLKEFGELDAGAAMSRRRALLVRTLLALLDSGKPVVAAIQGAALGAGLMLALAADEVVAADSARLGLPEIRLGMPSPLGFELVAARAGRVAAERLVQGGEAVSADLARKLGLVDEVVPSDDLLRRANLRAEARGAKAGAAYAANKRWVNRALRAAVEQAAAEATRLQNLRAGAA